MKISYSGSIPWLMLRELLPRNLATEASFLPKDKQNRDCEFQGRSNVPRLFTLKNFYKSQKAFELVEVTMRRKLAIILLQLKKFFSKLFFCFYLESFSLVTKRCCHTCTTLGLHRIGNQNKNHYGLRLSRGKE